MRLVIETRRVRVEAVFGSRVDEHPERDVELDALVESGSPDPHWRSELDGRRRAGFAPPESVA
jgi:hypothetical protein